MTITVSSVLIAAFASGSAVAQTVHEKIRTSLVFLKATGIGSSGKTIGVPLEARATGFLVSEDGLVLTVHHLLTKLGNVTPETLRIKASIAEKRENPEIRAQFVNAIPNLDLLLLKLPSAISKHARISIGSSHSVGDEDLVYTSGFPKSVPYIKREGKIDARDGPGGHLWATSLQIEDGQSGSPVYDVEGNVVGIAKGESSDESSIDYIIPIEFADPLLVQVRLGDIQNSLQSIIDKLSHPDHDPYDLNRRLQTIEGDIGLLRQQFDWTGEVEFSPDPMFRVSYLKLLAGDPHPAKVTLTIQPVGERDGDTVAMRPLPKIEIVRSLGTATTGVFENPEIVEDVRNLRSIYEMSRMIHLNVEVQPELSDGTLLRPETVIVPLLELQ